MPSLAPSQSFTPIHFYFTTMLTCRQLNVHIIWILLYHCIIQLQLICLVIVRTCGVDRRNYNLWCGLSRLLLVVWIVEIITCGADCRDYNLGCGLSRL